MTLTPRCLRFLSLILLPVIAACSSNSETPVELDGGEPVLRTDERPNIIFVFTDDQGYADLGVQGAVDDIRTPNIDRMAAEGVRMTDGYVTAPQCTPSRAALISGRYQQKFGVDDNRYTPFPLTQATLAEKLTDVGYKTGMVGKWHLEIDANSVDWFTTVYAPNSEQTFDAAAIPADEKEKYFPENRGFKDTFFGYINNFRTNFTLDGRSQDYATVRDTRFRVDVVSDAAIAFIERHKEEPFFLYVAYYAPHVPLEATKKYLDRFPGDMPERRRYALAMMSAIDDGVGRIMNKLESHNIDKDTIVFFISDNGAPLAMTKEDVMPVSQGGSAWDGSLNDPWVGEKGMLTEGAVRIPYIVKWKDHLPEGLEYNHPVSSLDAPATAAALAQVENLGEFDGINLVPYLNDPQQEPDRALYWRFWNQSAIRKGNWKYLQVGNDREFLFDLSSDDHENRNLVESESSTAAELRQELANWAETLQRPGLPYNTLFSGERDWYEYYFDNR